MTADDMPHPPRAVFDLDDTLIIGDIGEAVFAQLLANGHRMSLTWNDYQLLLRRNTFVAYTAVVQAMKGLRIADIEEAVRCVGDSGTGEITIEGLRVPVPRPHQIMTWLIRHLSLRGFDIAVISASTEFAVRIVCPKWFGIPEHRSFGVSSIVEAGIVTGELKLPIPLGEGKKTVYERALGIDPPYIAGGNSANDISMLNMVRENGLVIWLGEDRVSFEVMKAKLSGTRLFRFIPRPLRDAAATVRRLVPADAQLTLADMLIARRD